MYSELQLFYNSKADHIPNRFHSSSPASKRTLKPSTTTAVPPQQSPVTAPAHAPAMSAPSQPSSETFSGHQQTQSTPTAVNSRKRRLSGQPVTPSPIAPAPSTVAPTGAEPSPVTTAAPPPPPAQDMPGPPPVKKGRTNTPWTPAEEQRLKQMRDAGNSWSEIAKV